MTAFDDMVRRYFLNMPDTTPPPTPEFIQGSRRAAWAERQQGRMSEFDSITPMTITTSDGIEYELPPLGRHEFMWLDTPSERQGTPPAPPDLPLPPVGRHLHELMLRLRASTEPSGSDPTDGIEQAYVPLHTTPPPSLADLPAYPASPVQWASGGDQPTQASGDILDAIDTVIDETTNQCGYCGNHVTNRHASPDFCQEACQMAWQQGTYRRPAQPGQVRPARSGWRAGDTVTWADLDLAGLVDEVPGAPGTYSIGPFTARVVINPETTQGTPVVPAATMLRAFFDEVRASLAPVISRLAHDMAPLIEHANRCAEHAEPQIPTDPMERALYLRKHRNTGPKPKPRAPRRIDPRRAR